MKLSIIFVLSFLLVIVNSKLVHRIINGSKGDFDQFSYHATIVERVPFFGGYKYSPVCGATIISDSWILTAGHCTYGLRFAREFEQLKLIIGAIKLSGQDKIFPEIEKFYQHPNFSMDPLVINDIQLIKLRNPVPINKLGIVPAMLPSANHVFGGKAVTSGHGLVHAFTEDTSDHLLWVDIKEVDDGQCSKEFLNEAKKTSFNRTMNICAAAEPGKSPCNGDSGGPMVEKVDGKNLIVGIVSYGQKNCGQLGKAFVYTKVSNYRNWINEVTGL